MKAIVNKVVVVLLFFIGIYNYSYAEVILPRMFSNNMVIQRNEPVKLWGWAKHKEKITVSFLGKDYQTKANKNGEWEIILPQQKAGGPYNIIVSGNNSITLKNILFGDVWVCSGQSNMYFRTAAAKNSYKDIDNANYAKIRLFQIAKDANYQVQKDVTTGDWLECTPENVRGFSAVAYFFGRDLFEEIDVPIGLIHTSWGGSKIQAWMDGETIKKFSDYTEEVELIEENSEYFNQKFEAFKSKGGNLVIKELFKNDPGFENNGQELSDRFFNEKDWQKIKVPGYWEDLGVENYNGSIWYKKQFELPKAFKNKDLLLNLGWIDDYDFAFFNGKRIGSTTYKGSERKYTIPKDLLKEGINEILVCVYDKDWNGGFWGPRKSNIRIKEDKTLLNLDLQGIWEYKKGINNNDFYADSLTLNKQPDKRSTPTYLYNAMIAPLTSIKIKGVAWYQGESNAGNPDEYSKLLPAMIKGWRKGWKQGDFPFLIVQLPNYGNPNEDEPQHSSWTELREVQFNATNTPNTDLVVTIDLGDAMDIHPTNKQEVGRRSMLSALKLAYNMNVVSSGPTYKSMQLIGNKIEISFENIGSGLLTKNKFGYINEFAIAGEDKKFVWAKAYINGNKVVIYSEKVNNPVAVRYAWSSNPSQINLCNKEGLPAMPFRTDNW